MNSSRRKIFLLIGIIGLVLLMAGCTEVDQPITSESEGIWNTIFVYPMSLLITFLADIFGSNYAIGIILMTVLVRLLLVPLNVKQIKSQVAMQKIQPEIQKLQKKYSSKDANTQRKLQEEQIALFQKYDVNPLAGCLPLFIQMPILFAMYHAIMRTEAIKQGSFLWLELGSPDPYYILPLITGLATFFQQKLMMSTGTTDGANPQMTVMLYLMPIMITVFAIFLPSALALYWVVGNVFMIIQTILIRNPMLKEANTGGDTK